MPAPRHPRLPDPRALARFYSALLSHPITYASDDFVVVAANDTTSGLAFQFAPDHRAATWPDTAVQQQMHLDIMVESVLTCLVSARPSSTAKECLLIRPGIHFASSSVPAGLSPSRTDRHAHRLIAHQSRHGRVPASRSSIAAVGRTSNGRPIADESALARSGRGAGYARLTCGLRLARADSANGADARLRTAGRVRPPHCTPAGVRESGRGALRQPQDLGEQRLGVFAVGLPERVDCN